MLDIGRRVSSIRSLRPADQPAALAQVAKEEGLTIDDLGEALRQTREAELWFETQRLNELREEKERRRARYRDHPRLQPEDIDPWPEPVSPTSLLCSLITAIRGHVAMDDHSALAVALWAMHTHVHESFSVTPRLLIRSNVSRCGKTALLAVLSHIVPRPLDICAGSPSAILWSLGYRPVLLIDNGAQFIAGGRDLRALLHNGCQRAASRLLRSVQGLASDMALFTPAAVTVEGQMPRVLAGRSIEILLEPLTSEEKILRLRSTHAAALQDLGRMLARWAADCSDELRTRNDAVEFPEDENWLPLLLIAAGAGSEWEARTRAAMQALRGNSEDAHLHNLLRDIRAIVEDRRAGQLQLPAPNGKLIANRDRIRSADIARLLGEMEGRPWHEWGRSAQPITPHALARLLAQANIHPLRTRFQTADQNGPGPDLNERGYLLQHFDDAFTRYLPLDSSSQAA